MIEFYTSTTPNGYKVSIALEELQLPYNLHALNLAQRDQKKPEYLAINPNGKIPAIVDTEADNFAVFESGAILIYLAEKTGKLLPPDAKGRTQVMEWLMFQMSGIGPNFGNLHAFNKTMPEKLPAAIQRFQDESRRLLEVLNNRLGQSEYLAEDYSIADIATYPWAKNTKLLGLDTDDLPNFNRWLDLVAARPAVQKGLTIPPLK